MKTGPVTMLVLVLVIILFYKTAQSLRYCPDSWEKAAPAFTAIFAILNH